MPIPDHVLACRRRVAAMYLAGGSGIEIGALDAATPLPSGVRIRYVDFRTRRELASQYPELDARTFVDVDVVDDGERLAKFADASVDFVIANQMLEHCENPLGTIRRHLAVVRPGGWLLYAVPDRRLTFDRDRPITPFEHLVADDADGGAASREAHYLEWAHRVNGIADEAAARANARENMDNGYSIHFHVWDARAWLALLSRAHDYLGGAFECRHFEFTGTEILCALRRE